jgi:rhomboid family GlyGly-CTERM serine protease
MSPQGTRPRSDRRAAAGLDGRRGAVLLALCLLLIGLALVGDAAGEALRWSRTAIARGEHWRWVTGHLVHLDLAHAALNAAGLVLVWALFSGTYSGRRWLLIAACGIVTIDAGLWWLSDVTWYVGLSGVLNALAAAGIVREIIHGDRMAWLVGSLGLAKLVYENVAGPMPFLATDSPVVLDAHLFGALAGMTCGLMLRSDVPPVMPPDLPSAPRPSETAGA